MSFIKNLSKSLSAVVVLVLFISVFTLSTQNAHGQSPAGPYLSGISQTAATASSVTIQITTSETGDFGDTPVFYGAFPAGTSCTTGSNPWTPLFVAGNTFTNLLTPAGRLTGVAVARIDTVGNTDVTITNTALHGAIICAVSVQMGNIILLNGDTFSPTNLVVASQTIAFNFPNTVPVITLAAVPTTAAISKIVAFSATDSDAGDTLTFDWKLQANNTTCTAGGYGAAGIPLATSSGAGVIGLVSDSQNGRYICLRVGDGTTFVYSVSNQIAGLDTTGPTSVEFVNAFLSGQPTTNKEVGLFSGDVLEVHFDFNEPIVDPTGVISVVISDPQAATTALQTRTVTLSNVVPRSGTFPTANLKGTYAPSGDPFIAGTVTSISVAAGAVSDNLTNTNAAVLTNAAAAGEQARVDTTPIVIVSADVSCTSGCVTVGTTTYANTGDIVTVMVTFNENYDVATSSSRQILYGLASSTAIPTLTANSKTSSVAITIPATGIISHQGVGNAVTARGFNDGVHRVDLNVEAVPATAIHVDTIAPTFTRASALLCRVGSSGTTPCPNDIATAGDRFFLEHNFSERVNDNNGYTLAGISSSSITAAGFKTTNEALFNVPASGATQGAISTFNVAATVTDRAGNPFATLNNIPLTPTTFSIDTIPPQPPTIDLQAASDSCFILTGGTCDFGSNTDNITRNTTVTLDVSTEAGATVQIINGTTNIGTPSTGGPQIITLNANASNSLTAIATDAAGNTSNASTVLNVIVDTTPIAIPTALNLLATDDTCATTSGSTSGSGVCSYGTTSDNITKTNTQLDFNFGIDNSAAFNAGTDDYKVLLKVGTTNYGSGVLDGTTLNSGSGILADGPYSFQVYAVDLAGNTSTDATALSVTVDTAAPAQANAPDLQAGSDTRGGDGTDSDDLTNDTTPTFNLGTREANTLPILVRTSPSSTRYAPPANDITVTSITTTALAAGVNTFATILRDIAGNGSTASSTLDIRIDTTIGALTADLLGGSDSGFSATDNITKNDTLTFGFSSLEFSTAPTAGTGKAQVTMYRWNDANADGNYNTDAAEIDAELTQLWRNLNVASATESVIFGSGAGENAGFVDDGVYRIVSHHIDDAGNEWWTPTSRLNFNTTTGVKGNQVFVIDRTAPTKPSAPDLNPADDTYGRYPNTGRNGTNTDDITNDPTHQYFTRAADTETDAEGTAGSVLTGAKLLYEQHFIKLYRVLDLALTDNDDVSAFNTSVLESAADNVVANTPLTWNANAAGGDHGYYAPAYNFETIAPTAIAGTDKDYYVSARQVDRAGNVSAYSDVTTIKIDRKTPLAITAPVDIHPTSDTGTSNQDKRSASVSPIFISQFITSEGATIFTPDVDIDYYEIWINRLDNNFQTQGAWTYPLLNTYGQDAPAQQELYQFLAETEGCNDGEATLACQARLISSPPTGVGGEVDANNDGIDDNNFASGVTVWLRNIAMPTFNSWYGYQIFAVDVAGNTAQGAQQSNVFLTVPPPKPDTPDLETTSSPATTSDTGNAISATTTDDITSKTTLSFTGVYSNAAGQETTFNSAGGVTSLEFSFIAPSGDTAPPQQRAVVDSSPLGVNILTDNSVDIADASETYPFKVEFDIASIFGGTAEEGEYSLIVRALNSGGDTGPSSDTYNFTIDTTPPTYTQNAVTSRGVDIGIFTYYTGATGSTQQTHRFIFETQEVNAVGRIYTENDTSTTPLSIPITAVVSGATPARYTSPITGATYSGANRRVEQDYYYELVDAAGNASLIVALPDTSKAPSLNVYLKSDADGTRGNSDDVVLAVATSQTGDIATFQRLASVSNINACTTGVSTPLSASFASAVDYTQVADITQGSTTHCLKVVDDEGNVAHARTPQETQELIANFKIIQEDDTGISDIDLITNKPSVSIEATTIPNIPVRIEKALLTAGDKYFQSIDGALSGSISGFSSVAPTLGTTPPFTRFRDQRTGEVIEFVSVIRNGATTENLVITFGSAAQAEIFKESGYVMSIDVEVDSPLFQNFDFSTTGRQSGASIHLTTNLSLNAFTQTFHITVKVVTPIFAEIYSGTSDADTGAILITGTTLQERTNNFIGYATVSATEVGPIGFRAITLDTNVNESVPSTPYTVSGFSTSSSGVLIKTTTEGVDGTFTSKENTANFNVALASPRENIYIANFNVGSVVCPTSVSHKITASSSNVTSAADVVCDVSTLTDGEYALQTTLSDTAGNTQTLTSQTFTRDTTPPAITIVRTSGTAGAVQTLLAVAQDATGTSFKVHDSQGNIGSTTTCTSGASFASATAYTSPTIRTVEALTEDCFFVQDDAENIAQLSTSAALDGVGNAAFGTGTQDGTTYYITPGSQVFTGITASNAPVKLYTASVGVTDYQTEGNVSPLADLTATSSGEIEGNVQLTAGSYQLVGSILLSDSTETPRIKLYDLEVDNTPPRVVGSPTLTTSNSNSGFAKSADILTATIIVSEPLHADTTFSIAEIDATCSVSTVSGVTTATCSATLTNDASEGNPVIAIAGSDRAGNALIYSVTDTSIDIDATAPSVVVFTPQKLHQQGATIPVDVVLTDRSGIAAGTYQVALGTQQCSVTAVAGETRVRTQCQYTIPAGAAQGPINADAPVISDTPGNSFNAPAAPFVYVDTTAPTITNVTIDAQRKRLTTTAVVTHGNVAANASISESVTISYTGECEAFNDARFSPISDGSSTDPQTYTLTINPPRGLYEANTCNIKVVDTAGNEVESPITSDILIKSSGGSGGGGGGIYRPPVLVISTVIPTVIKTQHPTIPTAGGDTLPITITANLSVGSRSSEVIALQQFLNDTNCPVATTGAGSKGSETSYFGPATRQAVICYQKSNNISPASGFVGPITRGVINRSSSTQPQTLSTTPSLLQVPNTQSVPITPFSHAQRGQEATTPISQDSNAEEQTKALRSIVDTILEPYMSIQYIEELRQALYEYISTKFVR